jgi:TonB family protein
MTSRKYARVLTLAAFISIGAAAADAVSRPPELLDRAPVGYPRSELSSGREGFVTINAEVLLNGSVGRAEVERSSHVPALDEAALAGVKKWIYRPALDAAGKPVVAYVGEVVSFNPSDAVEWRRLGRIWNDYRHFVRVNEAVSSHCDALGVDTSKARAAVRADADTVQRVTKLEQIFIAELKAAGNPDPKGSIQQAGEKVDAYVDRDTDGMFAKWSKAQAVIHCKETLASMIELGWFYPGSDELLEF